MRNAEWKVGGLNQGEPIACPQCDKKMDGFTTISEGAPPAREALQPGMHGVCCYCGCIFTYEGGGKGHALTAAERDTMLSKAPELGRLLARLSIVMPMATVAINARILRERAGQN
jgi:hypothetical protein